MTDVVDCIWIFWAYTDNLDTASLLQLCVLLLSDKKEKRNEYTCIKARQILCSQVYYVCMMMIILLPRSNMYFSQKRDCIFVIGNTEGPLE